MGLGPPWDSICFPKVLLVSGKNTTFLLSFLRCLETHQALQGGFSKWGLQFVNVTPTWWKIKFAQEILVSGVWSLMEYDALWLDK